MPLGPERCDGMGGLSREALVDVGGDCLRLRRGARARTRNMDGWDATSPRVGGALTALTGASARLQQMMYIECLITSKLSVIHHPQPPSLSAPRTCEKADHNSMASDKKSYGLYCQKCRTPIDVDASIDQLNPAAFKLLTGVVDNRAYQSMCQLT